MLSADDHNLNPYHGAVLAAPIVRQETNSDGVVVPYTVNLNENDSVSGFVRVAETMLVPSETLEPPGRDEVLSGATLSNIKMVWDEFLGY